MSKWNDTPNAGDVQIGLDVARFGGDSTVFAIRQGVKLIVLEAHNGWSVTQTAGRAVVLCNEYHADSIHVDDTGVGGGVTDLLKEANMSTEVVPVNFGGAGDEHYANRTAVMAGNLKDRLLKGDAVLMDDIELVAQLTTRKYGLTGQGKILLERKEEMKKRGLSSPDKADAVFLAYDEPRTFPFFAYDSGEVKHYEYFGNNTQVAR